MLTKYGKSYGSITGLKTGFTKENLKNLEEMDRIKKIYSEQPKRESCKICGKKLLETPSFISHSINYFLCEKCSHLNGAYIETDEFTDKLYFSHNYSDTYSESDLENYIKRAEAIYLPKAEFMIEALKNDDKTLTPSNLKYADIGAGSGYFIYVMNKLGLNAKGCEVSKHQVEFAKKIGVSEIELIDKNSYTKIISELDADVVSFIGVFEHLVDIDEALAAVNSNPKIKYVYFSVPLFSLSVILEAANEDIFNRQLGGGHTHLFTLKSLNYLLEKASWEIKGRWLFGTDIPDLFRHILVKLDDRNKTLQDIFHKNFQPLIDELQLTLDKNEQCSEVHILAKVTR